MDEDPLDVQPLLPRRLDFDEGVEEVSVITQAFIGTAVRHSNSEEVIPGTPPPIIFLIPRVTPDVQVIPIEYCLDPDGLPRAVLEACMYSTTPARRKASKADENVLALPHLEECPKKNTHLICRCLEMSHFATSDYQDDVRKLYVDICRKGTHEWGNQFLMSMMLAKDETQVSGKYHGNHHLQFIVPGFGRDRDCRRFRLCSQQFCKLFNLSKARFSRLMIKRRESWNDIRDNEYYTYPMYSMGWHKSWNKYCLGETVYHASGDLSYKIYCECSEKKMQQA